MTDDFLPRLSGILMHPTSLPSTYGIGDLGNEAYAFVNFLEAAGQHLWQVLPLTHTGYGDSPYQSFSAFAGQPLLISLEHLYDLQLLKKEELSTCPVADPEHIDYGNLIPWKTEMLQKAHARFIKPRTDELSSKYSEFCEDNSWWLNDYALFMACKSQNGGKSWLEWDKRFRLPDDETKEKLKNELSSDMDFYRFIQFIFFEEWYALKAYANKKNIQIIGDIPIFVSMDSADVWANRHLFQLDSDGYPVKVAGVPPDYFSATGQLWGNPLYNWAQHEKEDYSWWISRIKSQLNMLDILRIDHFRGFESYWAIPYGEKTAVNGEWVKAPGKELFQAITAALGTCLPIIAEDLGVITPEVNALRDQFHFPGMKVLQFAFESTGESDFLPHQFKSPHCVCYTGTHDNDTTAGWFQALPENCREKVCNYMNTDSTDISMSFIRTCLSSIAAYAIFPLQDVLLLGTKARMNYPGNPSGNWNWRCKRGVLTEALAKKLKDMSQLYGRY